MKAIEILKNFVEEKLSTEELEMALSSNQELISLLESTKAYPVLFEFNDRKKIRFNFGGYS